MYFIKKVYYFDYDIYQLFFKKKFCEVNCEIIKQYYGFVKCIYLFYTLKVFL